MSQTDSPLQASTQPDFPYDSWERVYRESGMHELPWDTPEAHPLLVQIFKDHRAVPGVRALDLGCGTGASSRLLARVGYQVNAWDVSETVIERARALSPQFDDSLNFTVGNVVRGALSDPDRYDLVLDFLFLHHVQAADVATYFSGIRRVLRPGGDYVVGVFVHDGEPVRRPSLYAAGQVTYWSRSELEARLPGLRCTVEWFGQAGDKTTHFPMGLFKFTCPTKAPRGRYDV